MGRSSEDQYPEVQRLHDCRGAMKTQEQTVRPLWQKHQLRLDRFMAFREPDRNQEEQTRKEDTCEHEVIRSRY